LKKIVIEILVDAQKKVHAYLSFGKLGYQGQIVESKFLTFFSVVFCPLQSFVVAQLINVMSGPLNWPELHFDQLPAVVVNANHRLRDKLVIFVNYAWL